MPFSEDQEGVCENIQGDEILPRSQEPNLKENTNLSSNISIMHASINLKPQIV
jgi:hypothetical protein